MAEEVGAASRGTTEMLETGVPNLDRVLGGGLIRGALVMVVGAPGTGKTMLAQQIMFHGVAGGTSALYLTGYSESHDKLVAHGRGLSFFADELVGDRIQLLSLPDLLELGPTETELAIVRMARDRRATLVVLDGFRSMRRYWDDDLLVAHFLYSLGAKLGLIGATTLVTAEGHPGAPSSYPELTVCDVILGLYRERRDGQHRRLLDVMKVRGAPALDGLHPFTIDQAGVSVHPRLESIVPTSGRSPASGKAGFGIAEIDALLGGGPTVGSTTIAAGSPGMGKSLLGLHFVAEGSRLGEPGLFVSFRETEAQLREKARAFGIDLSEAEATGGARLLALPSFGSDADRIADALREDVERRGVRRLVIDSAGELERSIELDERKPEFLAALKSYLRGRGVTTYLSLDVLRSVGQELDLTATPLAGVPDNVLLLRDVEYLGQSHHVISVIKADSLGHDRTIREYDIAAGRGVWMLGVTPVAAAEQASGTADVAGGQDAGSDPTGQGQ